MMSHEYYKTLQGDTWDLISYKIFGEEKYLIEIYNLNPEYSNIAIFEGGVELKIPVISVEITSTLPPWKR